MGGIIKFCVSINFHLKHLFLFVAKNYSWYLRNISFNIIFNLGLFKRMTSYAVRLFWIKNITKFSLFSEINYR